ncbi:Irregular chiasm C-roughest protein [Schistosoma japonicum]|nr:Irregular chiasm C-roughest protein [Schistosoma japonicum]
MTFYSNLNYMNMLCNVKWLSSDNDDLQEEDKYNKQNGPQFTSPLNDVYSGELGQIVYLECSANSNPESDVSLYYIGPNGQFLLNELTKLELAQNQLQSTTTTTTLLNSNQPKYILWNSETELAEFNLSVMETAIQSTGKKLLASEFKQVLYKLHLTNHEQFGFYACTAQTIGYPPIHRIVYVGQAEEVTRNS